MAFVPGERRTAAAGEASIPTGRRTIAGASVPEGASILGEASIPEGRRIAAAGEGLGLEGHHTATAAGVAAERTIARQVARQVARHIIAGAAERTAAEAAEHIAAGAIGRTVAASVAAKPSWVVASFVAGPSMAAGTS